MDINDEKIDLTKYLDRFYRAFLKLRKVIVLIVVCCIALFEVKILLFFDTVYSSQAVFIASMGEQDNIYASNDNNDDFLSTFSSVITGPMMRKVIMKDMGTQYIPGNIVLSRVPETNLIELKVTSSNPEDAFEIINCIIHNYNQVTDMVMSDVNLAVLETPQLASAPDALPDYLNSGIKGMGVGVAIGLAVTIVFMFLRHTILGNDDVKEVLHLQNIAKIPYTVSVKRNYSKGSHLLLSNPRIQYGFKQSFYDIRLKIEQENKKNGMRTILVTSAMPNEGKTMTSTNIAIALAEKGHKVVLVDLDLRNPSVFNVIKENQFSGNIVDYLKGSLSLDEITNQYKDYSLDIIYGMKTTTSSPELLSKDKFKQFMILLKEKYDFVILDVPPLYMMEDTILISEQCDSAIVVIKQDYVNAYDILDSLEELNEHIPYILGTVLNQVKPSLFDQEQAHHGHGYGYGYGRK